MRKQNRRTISAVDINSAAVDGEQSRFFATAHRCFSSVFRIPSRKCFASYHHLQPPRNLVLLVSDHWDKHRSLHRSLANASGHPSATSSGDIESSPFKPKPPFPYMKKNHNLSVPVLMPGDNTPKFIALPCPCAPPRQEKLTVDVQSPQLSPRVKPPRLCSSVLD